MGMGQNLWNTLVNTIWLEGIKSINPRIFLGWTAGYQKTTVNAKNRWSTCGEAYPEPPYLDVHLRNKGLTSIISGSIWSRPHCSLSLTGNYDHLTTMRSWSNQMVFGSWRCYFFGALVRICLKVEVHHLCFCWTIYCWEKKSLTLRNSLIWYLLRSYLSDPQLSHGTCSPQNSSDEGYRRPSQRNNGTMAQWPSEEHGQGSPS